MKKIFMTLPIIGMTCLSGCGVLGGGGGQQYGNVPDDSIDLRLVDGARPSSTPTNSTPSVASKPRYSSGFGTISNATGDTYRVRNGQSLKIDGYRGFSASERIFSESVTIDGSGMINVPNAGKVLVGGFTIPEVSDAIESKLRSADPVAGLSTKVHVAAIQGQLIAYVSGQVKRPGKVAFKPGMTVQSAITAAGGFTSSGKGKNISVTSRGTSRSVNFPDANGDGSSADFSLQPGDTITVPRSIF